MKIHLNKTLALFFLLFLLKGTGFAQAPPPLTVPNYTACPCQTITASATWNNVSSITYSLLIPGPPPSNTVFAVPNFPVFNCSQTLANVVYTLIANGSFQGNPVTQTVNFTLTIVPPAAMTLTSGANNGNFCYGSNAVISAPIGGTQYVLNPGNIVSGSNLINVPNLTASSAGPYTVTSVISGCTVTGVTNINVAPLKVLTVNSTSNICQNSTVSVILTSNMAGGQSPQWYDNYGSPLPNNGNPNFQLPSPLSTTNSGVYNVTMDDFFNGILCPYTASTTVNVVGTNPVVPSASPSGTLCQGQTLNFSANLTNAVPAATSYSWAGPQFTSSQSGPSIPNLIPSNSGIYTVTASFISPFASCNTTAAITVSVVGITQPVITMSSSVCQDATVALSGTAGVNPLTAYEWIGPAFPTGTTGAAVNINAAQPNASGTYVIKAIFSNFPQCSSTASAQLNVVPVNTVSVIPPGQICTPNNAFLQALATGANSYQWSGPNGFTSPGANVYVYYPTPSASGIYTVTAYFGSGGNLVCTNSNTVQLTVNPVLNFSLVPRQQVCYNSSITVSGPPGATSYSWTSSTGYVSYVKDLVLTSAQPNNSGTYTLNISLGPCKSSASSELVVLNPIQFTLTPFDRTVCKGDTLMLEGGATGGSENYAYTWNPGVYLESTTGPQQMSVPLGSVLYNLMVHDIACPNYTIAHAFNVNVKQPPMPNLQLERSEGCNPLIMTYDAGTKNEAVITTYDFGNNRVFQQRDSITPVKYSLDAPGTYTLRIYSKGKNGCSGVYEYPYPLVVYPTPGSDVAWSPEIPTTTDDITFQPSSKEPVTDYSWTFLGGVTLGDTNSVNSTSPTDTSVLINPVRLYEQYGTYPVMLISKNTYECTDTVVKFVKVIDDLQIYVPNSFTPNDDGVNDVFMAKGSGMKLENYSMEIFNRAGLVVFSTKDINEGWDGKVKGQVVKDADYIYRIRVVGMNGEGRKEITGYITLLK